jgi:probable phosphoglycerate mutase
MNPMIFLIRHGETEWSRSGQHTSYTDLPLTSHGQTQARALAPRLKGIAFAEILTSPRERARATCELAGCGASMRIDARLQEWNYGEYEGLKLAQIHERQPKWDLFRDGCPGGETAAEMTLRVDAVVDQLRTSTGAIALFSHGHLLRSLAARWLNQPLTHARSLLLAPGSLSLLTFELDYPVVPAIALWNEAGAALRVPQ